MPIIVLVAAFFMILTAYLFVLTSGQSTKMKKLETQIASLKDQLKQAGISALTADYPDKALPKVDTTKTQTYSSKDLSFSYFNEWKLKENKLADGQIGTIEVASDESLFGTANVTEPNGLIKVRRTAMSWLTTPDDYLQQVPYAVANKTKRFSLGSVKVIETHNQYQNNSWIETLVVGDPQTPYTVITAYPDGSDVTLKAYNLLLQSLKTSIAPSSQ
jgi:hypothetical protein